MECLHLDKACGKGQAQAFSSISEEGDLECSECQDTTSVWICVTCGSLNCGRYVAAHGLKHKEKTKTHSVCMETKQLSVFCYDCDEFVINDTSDKYLESVRNILLQRNLAQSEESSSSGRSLRARRKRPLSASVTTPSPARLKVSKKENKQSKEEKSASPKKRLGLKNLGNTCFMNSVLQSLSNIEEFSKVIKTLPSLDERQAKKNKERRKSGGQNGALGLDGIILTDELKKVIVALNHGEEKSAISPDSLFQAVWKVVPRFRGYQQQDAHEFLRYMLDRLHTELLHLLPCVDHKMRMLRSQSNSVVTAVFGGTLQSCVTCLTCHQSSKTDDPFLDLSVDIPPAYGGPVRKAKEGEEQQPVCNIHDCLQKFVEKEELADSERFYCRSCKSKQPSTKQFCIRRLPTVLCLHIKRFRWSQCTRTKVDTFIEFPLNGLDMSQ